MKNSIRYYIQLLVLLLVFNQAHAFTQAEGEVDVTNCKINLQNLDEVFAAELAGKLVGPCFSLNAQNKYWPIGVPTQPSNLQKKYTPKGKSVHHHARYFKREQKVLGVIDEPDFDGKPSKSYRMRFLVTLMYIEKTNTYKPICEIVDGKMRYAKLPWGWFSVENTDVPPGGDVSTMLKTKSELVSKGKVPPERFEQIKKIESQCKKTL